MTQGAPALTATRWVEPALAALALAFALVVEQELGLPARLLTVALCLSAGLSGVAPRASWCMTAGALLAFLVVPAGEVSVAGLASFVNVFAAVRLNVRGKVPLAVTLTAATWLVMVWHPAAAPTELLTPTALVLVLAAMAIGAGATWLQADIRVTTERVLADGRVAELRAGLARDLHDTVAQTLSHAAMRARVLALSPDRTLEVKTELERIADDCSSSAHDLRQLLSTLRGVDGASPSFGGPVADAETLRSAVEEQAERLRAHGFLPTTEVSVGPVSSTRATTLTMVTIEATTNIIKHAPPRTSCHVSITEDGDHLLAVFSNRSLARRINPRGLGLIGIEERAALLRGSCTVTRDDGWWHVAVRLPRGQEALPHEHVPA